MYRCKECKAEYKNKVEYCDCGNNTFDFIEDQPVKSNIKEKKTLTVEQKNDIISKVFFILCIILSAIVWLIPIGDNNHKNVPQTQNKRQQAVTKNIPSIDKIWDSTPIYQPKTIEQQTEKITPVEYARQL